MRLQSKTSCNALDTCRVCDKAAPRNVLQTLHDSVLPLYLSRSHCLSFFISLWCSSWNVQLSSPGTPGQRNLNLAKDVPCRLVPNFPSSLCHSLPAVRSIQHGHESQGPGTEGTSWSLHVRASSCQLIGEKRNPCLVQLGNQFIPMVYDSTRTHSSLALWPTSNSEDLPWYALVALSGPHSAPLSASPLPSRRVWLTG